MSIFQQFLENQILMCAAAGWCVAQVIKALIDMWSNGRFRFERLYGNGGMPSSHSATVCAMFTSAACAYGFSSYQFAICFMMAVIVMVDAMGVRRETGKQSKLLNLMMKEDFWDFADPEKTQMRLKEFMGHTPLQVFCGAALGIVVALLLEGIVYG